MNDQTPSGNRWEPTDAAPATSTDPAPPPPPVQTREVGRLTSLRQRLLSPGGRSWKVAAATVLLLGGGAGGYAVGHTTADQAAPGDRRIHGFDGPAPDGDQRFGGRSDRFPGTESGGTPGQFGTSGQEGQ